MNAEPSAGPYLAAKLRALDTRLREVAPRVLSSSGGASAVHDLRVALRRTRTVLEASRSIFGRFRSDEVRALLRDVQQATGALRDEEVLLELVASLPVRSAEVEAWLKTRRGRERRLRRVLAHSIEVGDLDRGRRLLDALLAFRVEPSRERRLAKFARRAVADARRRADRRRAARVDDPRALHRLRIAYKRLRYVVETFADVLPSDILVLAQTAARLQTRLGRIHDVDVALGCVQRARTLSPEARAELLSTLERVREECVAAYASHISHTGHSSHTGEIAPLANTAQRRERHEAYEVGAEALRKSSTR